MMEDDKDLTVQEAIDRACMARNQEVNVLGYSPDQVVFGQQSVIPGITDGDIATDEIVSDSDLVFKRMKELFEARDTFREADKSSVVTEDQK